MSQTRSAPPAVLLFDINETLLDLHPLRQSVEAFLGESEGASFWFNTMLHYSLVMTVAGQFVPFPEIGAATLKMLAKNRGMQLSDDDAKKVISPLLSLPPHPDVRPALERLRQAGFRLAALTNSSLKGVQSQLANAGLADCFDRQLSVETVGKYKPHPDVYHWAAKEMQASPDQCMLIAAHGWDTAGAAWAGMQTAFITRPGQQEFPLAKPADLVARDLTALADALIASR